ncbi:UDP-glucosyl transferase 85A3, putative isoform 1 [Hibiscus syriacus]|uniref:UDP-glucosyl transferase 85A3, putative isoform 1 n=1 Tax=Hibiscus syriacus TaxID=106335 RepID=A0A6A3CM18_HIBSY|nr:uncharacterized protein LOC120166135 [Hibiscus syriacus]XP_039031433.1 uncharacterized protein LOC120166135 [Hibiscus syriacus]XP_039031440.1 uncharacterized protein LOC120166135 [Hibiscus syriacus]KAE8730440.1 UDP-glucosyl transferase 85A3, putative isoform 1 [Hibiscus syriacus]
MGFGSKSGRSSNIQQSSQTGKEKAHLPHAGKSNVKNGITFPYGVLPGEIGNNRIRSALVESKPPLKSRSTKEDELVRYMSNLPGYLQRVDSSDNLQEKALNVGVLDWTRLEKWKHHRKHIPTRSGNDESSTIAISSSKTNTKLSAFSNVVPKVASANKGKQHCSSLTPSQKDGIPRGSKPSIPKVRQYQDIETASKSTLDQQKKTSKMYKSFDKINSDAIIEKGKRNESDQKITSEMRNMPSNMRNHGVSPQPKETARVCDDGSRNRVEKRREKKVNKKDLDDKGTSDVEASSSKSRNHAVSMGSKKMLGAESHKPKNKETQESELDLNHECPPGEHKNIVLPSSVQNNLFEEPRDRALNEAKWNSSSCDLLQKDHFRELYSEVPHSCTFPSGVEMNPETDMIAWGLEPSSNSSSGSLLSDNIENIRSQRKYSADNKTKSQEADFETSRKLEEEMAELATERSRTSSRNRRFSFSLRRISRSFSFKESSAVPQLSSDFVSMRSGPVRPEFSGFLHDGSIEKLNGHHRTRSSPFRRVLDPLLKSKGLNSFRSTDTVQPSKGSLISSTQRPLNTNESFQEEKLGPSKIKALLEVAMKDGLPLFRFVVTNGSNMLATTVKSSASSGKVGSDQNYVFSSVREIKKSGSWISKGNKGKNCGYIYNIIGQMKISYSHISDVSAENSCNDLVRESVLFCVGQRQADQALAKFIPGTELAAVVIKIPGESNLQQADKDVEKTGSTESLATDGCSCNFMESSSFSSTTVILPGGVHGLPNKGMPSPLIDRWRFGGSCDCGGWDIGCKLHVFSNQNKRCCKNSRTHQAFPDRLELYPQGKAHKNMPIFGLVPHRKGIYAIEFSSSITELQAFFISVTVISCRKQSSDLPEFGNLLEGEVIKEKMLDGGFGIDNNPTIPLGTLPAKYAPNPPHSPVGRV